jgi:hypothetical protein
MNAFAESLTGWQKVKTLNLYCDRDILERWGNDFLYMVKKQIKKAERNNISIESIAEIPLDIWKKAFERKYLVTPVSPERLSGWCRQLIAKSLLKVFAAKIEGRVVAFRAQLLQGEYAYDWVAGSDPEFNIMGINQLLMAEIGDFLRNRSVKIWDMVGGQIRGIAEFKRSFGAKDINHYHVVKCFNARGALFQILRKIKNAARR